MVGSPRWAFGGCCTAVVVSLGILPYTEWLDTFCQGVQLSLLAFLVSSGDLDIRTGRSMADGMSLPRVMTKELLYCGQRTPSLRGEVLGADTTGPAVARVGTMETPV